MKFPNSESPTAYPKKFSPQPNTSKPSLHSSFLQSYIGWNGLMQEHPETKAIVWWSPQERLMIVLFLKTGIGFISLE